MPLSLICKSRLTEESTTTPTKPETAINMPATMPCGQVRTVRKGAKNADKTVVTRKPPIKPLQVLFGLTLGIIFDLPKCIT